MALASTSFAPAACSLVTITSALTPRAPLKPAAYQRVTAASILARCPLWVADYHDSPEVPQAWAAAGWKLWQYAGDEHAGKPAYGQTNIVKGVSHCDRNLFNGDAAGLRRFWGA